MRQTEEQGEMEEILIQMLRASLAPYIRNMNLEQITPTLEQIPASQGLRNNVQLQTSNSSKGKEGPTSSPQDRVPASLCLGPPIEPS